MGVDIETREPTRHEAGTTLKFKRTFPDFPADTWDLTYELRSHENAPITISATADGTDHSVDEAFSTTVDWNAGTYKMTGYVTKSDSSERYRVYQGSIIIDPYAGGEGNYEWRTYNERMVAQIEAVIEGRMARDDLSYSINGRSFTSVSHEDLLKAYDYFKAEVLKEQNKGKNRKILGRFRRAR